MINQTIRYHMVRDEVLDDDNFSEAVGAAHPGACQDTTTPFALSFDLFVADDQITPDPRCRVWVMENGWAKPLNAQDHAWISERYGAAIFAFLAKTDMRELVEEQLLRMIPSSNGETFTYALCADGIVLAADEATSVAYHYSESSALALFRPKTESNHRRIEGDANLLACAKAMITRPRGRGVDLVPAAS